MAGVESREKIGGDAEEIQVEMLIRIVDVDKVYDELYLLEI